MAKHDDLLRLRRAVAQEAARIIHEQGIEDFRQAKHKAAHRLKARGKAALPTNMEIETALIAHQSLFGRDEHDQHIHALRQAALTAMHMLDQFEPRLVGPVLQGTATRSSPVNLHAFCDTPETVLGCIEDYGLDVGSYERRLKSRRDETRTYPGYRFRLNGTTVETTVFAYDGLRQAPISPVDGRPMRRANREKVQALALASAALPG